MVPKSGSMCELRMKLETLNLAQRWTAVSTNEKNAKLGQKGCVGSRGPLFGILGPSLISLGQIKLETSNLAQRWMAVSTNQKMQN